MREKKSKAQNLLYNYPKCYDIVFDHDVSSKTAFARNKSAQDEKQIAWRISEVRATENGHTRTMRHRTREAFPTPLFLEAPARLSGVLEPVAWSADFDLKHPYDDEPSTKSCISVYRRPQDLEIGSGDK